MPRSEIDIQRKLEHPNVITLLDAFETESEFCIVTEFAQGELFEILEARAPPLLLPARAARLIARGFPQTRHRAARHNVSQACAMSGVTCIHAGRPTAPNKDPSPLAEESKPGPEAQSIASQPWALNPKP